MHKPAPATLTVRPSQVLRPRLKQLAEETGKSEGQVILESAEAIVEMVDGGEDFVPALVQRARILREHLANVSSTGLLGGGEAEFANDNGIRRSEIVKGLSPNLIFLPVYDEIPREFPVKCAMVEQIGVPISKLIKSRIAMMGIKVAARETKRGYHRFWGCNYTAGDILLAATPEQMAESLAKKDGLDALTSRHGVLIAGFFKGNRFVGKMLRDAEGPGRHLIEISSGHWNATTMRIHIADCTNLLIVTHVLTKPKKLEDSGDES